MYIVVYVVILVQSLSTFLLILLFQSSSIKECRILKIEFTFIADQIHDILTNVTGNQHKTIFLSVVKSLDEVHETKDQTYTCTL